MVSMAHGNSGPRAASFIDWPLSGTLRAQRTGSMSPGDAPVMHGARPLTAEAAQRRRSRLRLRHEPGHIRDARRHPGNRKTPFPGPLGADGGTRTRDLLHGKQTL